jgi:hypothetical protein
MPSHIPAAIDGLVTICRNLQATTLAGVDVYDGPKMDDSQNGRRIFVGYDVEGRAADGEQEWASMPRGGNARAERMTIHCVVESSTGQTDMKGRRDDAFTILGIIEAAVKSDPTLGGAVTYSNLGNTIDVRQPQSAGGAICTVFFGVWYYVRFS